MSNVEANQTSINCYSHKLTRKLILITLPFILLPIIIIGILLYLLIGITNTQLMILVVGITLLTVILSISFLSIFIHNQVIRPIKIISEITEEIKNNKLDKKLSIKRRDEIGELMENINQISEKFYDTRSTLDSISIEQSSQIKTCAEIAMNSTTANSIDDLIQMAASSILEEFKHYLVVFYLKSKSGDKISVQSIATSNINEAETHGFNLVLDEETIVGWVASNNETRRSTDVSSDPLYKPLIGFTETKSELAIPISIDNEVYGVLDLHDMELDGFTSEETSILQVITDIIAVYIHNFGIISNARFDPRITAYLFNASYQIILATNTKVIFHHLSNVLKRLPFLSTLYYSICAEWQCILYTDSSGNVTGDIPPRSLSIDRSDLTLTSSINSPINLSDLNNNQGIIPEELFLFALDLDYRNLLIFPIFIENNLHGILFLGTIEDEPIHVNLLNAVSKLMDITEASLANIHRSQSSKHQLDHLRVLNSAAQYLSNKITQHNFFATIHQQVLNAIGEVNFQLLLYSKMNNMIEIPYHYDGEHVRKYPPSPLEEGLIASIIRAGEPILLPNENGINTQESLIGLASNVSVKSWVGVPILVGDEISGAIVLQDFENENRFTETELVILTTLASFIGITLDSGKSIIGSSRFAEQEQTVSTFASRLSQSMDIDNILKMAVLQLGQLPGIQDASIHIKPPKS